MAFSIKPPGDNDEVYTPLAEMNVTPFIDVMLVLLIIFMVTAPMLATGMNVELPRTSAAQPLEPQEPIVVSVGSDGNVSVGADELARADVVDRVRSLLGNSTKAVHIKGDKAAAYADVVGLLDDLATAGITRLSIITRTKEPRAGAPR
jgi:biopolymer transport protein TolR